MWIPLTRSSWDLCWKHGEIFVLFGRTDAWRNEPPAIDWVVGECLGVARDHAERQVSWLHGETYGSGQTIYATDAELDTAWEHLKASPETWVARFLCGSR